MTEIVIGGDMADISEGTYPATLKSLETKFSEKFGGEFRAWDFELENGSVVGGASSLSTNGKSKGGKWIAALLGRVPEKGEKVTDLVGRKCLVHVFDKDGWPAVDAVLPPMAAAPVSVAPAASPAPLAALPDLP